MLSVRRGWSRGCFHTNGDLTKPRGGYLRMEVKSLAFSSSSIKLPASQDVSKVMDSKTPDCYLTRSFYTQKIRPSEAEVGDFEEEIDCRGTLNPRFEKS